MPDTGLTAAPSTGGTLRELVGSRGWPGWVVATFGARLPVAMAPLALVFAGQRMSDGYVLSGVLVGVHTLGEALAAPAAGALVDRWTARRVLAACLAAEALLFVCAAAVVAAHGNPALLIVLVALAGAIPAGAPGGLRSILTDLVGRAVLPRALSLDTVLNQICWGIGPLLVSVTVATASPAAALLVTAVPAAVAAAVSLRLPDVAAHRAAPATSGLVPVLRRVSRTLLLTAALRIVLGVLTVAAVPLFTSTGTGSFAGVALAAYAIGTAAGSVAYSVRPWPGGFQRQADVSLTALGLVIVLALVVDSGPGFVALYALAGLFEGPVVLARSLHLETILPPGRRATGFSMQYAAIGWGFAAGSMVLAPLLTVAGPANTIGAAGAGVALLAFASLLRPSRVPANAPRDSG